MNANGGRSELAMRGRGDFTIDQPVFFRINDDNTGPELLVEVFKERGWQKWSVKDQHQPGVECHQWHIWWRHSFPTAVYKRLKHNQVLNHAFRANGLCRKDGLARSLQKMAKAFPQAFDFSPSTYLLPGEYTKLVSEYTRILCLSKLKKSDKELTRTPRPAVSSSLDQGDLNTLNIWICKPIGSSQGKGISLFQDIHDLTYDGSTIVQRYLERPLVIGGYKCDIRLYVLVTSFLPLSVYIYTEGIVRFGTEKYNLEVLDNPFSHLTNTSINKLSPGYKVEKHRVGMGCKWTMKQLRRHLRANGQRDWLLWQKLNALVSLTLMSQAGISYYNSHGSHFPKTSDQTRFGTCFELYGFDILIDEDLDPWLLEVNRCPSLTYDCDVDRVVKKPLLHHLFDLVGPPRVLQNTETPYQDSVIPNEVPLFQSQDLDKNLIYSNDRSSKDHTNKNKASSICEECDDSSSKSNISNGHIETCNNPDAFLIKWRNGLRNSNSLSKSNKINSILKALSTSEEDIHRRQSISNNRNIRRQRSITIDKELTKCTVPEEIGHDTYVPLSYSSTFHRLRRQLILDYCTSNRYATGEPNWSSLFPFTPIPRPLSSRSDVRPQHKQPARCGGWIRTFPYNAATLHGSRNPLYLKSLVAEIMKYKRTSEKIFKENISEDDEFLCQQIKKLFWADHILWLPEKL